MKKLLLILLCLPMIGFGQQTYVPDDNFEQALINLGYDAPPLDDYVYTSMINTVTSLDISNTGITDYTGIEGFVALTDFDCNDNSATTLDLSNNTILSDLECQNNQLTSLDVSGCTALQEIRVSNNSNLTNFNVSGCTAMTLLFCNQTALTNLDVSGLTSLIHLECNGDLTYPLTNLNVNNCPNLTWLYAVNNSIINLDLSSNISLQHIFLRDGSITSLDVSNSPNLQILEVHLNNLTSLNVTNTSLRFLTCDNNQLATLDLSNQGYLELFSARYNELTSLDLYGCTYPGLEIDLSYNLFTSLDVSCATNLAKLEIMANWLLTSLNLQNSSNQSIQEIRAYQTNLNCVQVDNDGWSFVNWGIGNQSSIFSFPSSTTFSTNCGLTTCSYTTSIKEHTTNKELLKVTDLLGREAKDTKNEILFYIYDDGTVEKRIVIE